MTSGVDPSRVSLRAITTETVRAVTALAVAPSQTGFVASNAVSLAQALFAPEAWYRAIHLDDEPVGFVMLSDGSRAAAPAEVPGIGVWRLMVDARHQGRGIGRAALGLVVEHVTRMNRFDALELSFVPGPGSPEPFYRGLGFQPTGRVDEGEIVLALPLARASRAAAAASDEAAGGTRLAGACACGAVRYEVPDAFLYALNCHCAQCRKATGSAFKPFAGIGIDAVRLVSGEADTFRVGEGDARDIRCRRCGSLLYSVVRDGRFAHVTLGTLDDTPSIRPQAHICVGSKAAWDAITDGLPQRTGVE